MRSKACAIFDRRADETKRKEKTEGETKNQIAADPLGFSGLTEALMISNRTLNDVLSSLREVSMASVSPLASWDRK